MGELIELPIYGRSKTGYNFGPETLRGKSVAAPDLSLAHLTARQRVERILKARWATVSEISDLADIEAYHVRQICSDFVREDVVEKRQHARLQKTFEYRMKSTREILPFHLERQRAARYSCGILPHGPSAA